MKKTISLLLAALLLFSALSSCRNGIPLPDADTTPVAGSTGGAAGSTGGAAQDHENTPDRNEYSGTQLSFRMVYPRALAGVTYAIDPSGQLHFRVGAWDREFFVQTDLEYSTDPVVSAVTLENTGWLLAATAETTDEILVIAFGRDMQNLPIYPVKLEEAMRVTDIFCNFVSDSLGFLFVFSDKPEQRFVLLKTIDGGRSWKQTEASEAPTAAPGESPTLARFASERVGMVSYGYSEADGSAPDLSSRTYLTANGGVTWQPISALSYAFEVGTGEGCYYTEGTDLTYDNGTYLLRLIARNGRGGYIEVPYLSSDLQHWEVYDPFPELAEWGKAYLPILKQRMPYYHALGQFPQYLTPEFTHYAVTDLDQDGKNEVLVQSPDTLLVLREEDGMVYGFPLDFKSTDRIDENGICYRTTTSHVGQESGAYRFRFSGNACQCTEIHRIVRNELPERQYTEYYIYGEYVSEEEMLVFLEQLGEAPEVVWHTMPKLHYIQFETGKW